MLKLTYLIIFLSTFFACTKDTPKALVKYVVTVESQIGGSTIGGGIFDADSSCTVRVLSEYNYNFTGWYNGRDLVSRSIIYTFTVTEDVTLEANFEKVYSPFNIDSNGLLIEYTGTDENITIPSVVTVIGDSAFYKNKYLVSVNIPNTVTRIGRKAFDLCTSLTKVYIPNSVTSIDDYAFAACSSLSGIEIPSSVIKIGAKCFYNCGLLRSITIPDGVKNIENYTFYNCSSLKSIILPDSLSTIDDYAFYNCVSLELLNMPNTLTSIGNYSFRNCLTLQSINIPNSVNNIGISSFEYCSGLDYFKVGWQYPPANISKELVTYSVKTTLMVPSGSKSNYSVRPWTDFETISEY